MNKTCTKCGEVKPIDDFYRQAKTKDGRRYDCKVCFKKPKQARPTSKPPTPERPVKLPPADALAPCPGCGRLIRDRLWCSSSCRREAREVVA